jgi:hypothetical protein
LDNWADDQLLVVSALATKGTHESCPVCAKIQGLDFSFLNPAAGSSNHRFKITEYLSSSKEARGVKDLYEAKEKRSRQRLRLPPARIDTNAGLWHRRIATNVRGDRMFFFFLRFSFRPGLEERGDKGVPRPCSEDGNPVDSGKGSWKQYSEQERAVGRRQSCLIFQLQLQSQLA